MIEADGDHGATGQRDHHGQERVIQKQRDCAVEGVDGDLPEQRPDRRIEGEQRMVLGVGEPAERQEQQIGHRRHPELHRACSVQPRRIADAAPDDPQEDADQGHRIEAREADAHEPRCGAPSPEPTVVGAGEDVAAEQEEEVHGQIAVRRGDQPERDTDMEKHHGQGRHTPQGIQRGQAGGVRFARALLCAGHHRDAPDDLHGDPGGNRQRAPGVQAPALQLQRTFESPIWAATG